MADEELVLRCERIDDGQFFKALVAARAMAKERPRAPIPSPIPIAWELLLEGQYETPEGKPLEINAPLRDAYHKWAMKQAIADNIARHFGYLRAEETDIDAKTGEIIDQMPDPEAPAESWLDRSNRLGPML